MSSVVVRGVVVRKNKEFCLINAKGNRGRSNFIRVWDLPEDTMIGDEVSVGGELTCGKIGFYNTKFVLGVCAKRVAEEWEAAEVTFSGKIIGMSEKVRVLYSGKCILDMSVRIDEDTVAPVIVWNGMADKVRTLFKVGDSVRIKGYLHSREYQKVKGDSVIKKLTSEISATSVYCD